jgi:hypothetical protein
MKCVDNAIMDAYSCNVNWTSILGGDNWKSMDCSLNDTVYRIEFPIF